MPLLLGVLLFLVLRLPAYADSSVVLNKIYPHPATGGKEWVEIYNSGSQSITIQNWLITEKTSTDKTKPHNLPNIELPSHQNCYYEFSINYLNDGQDTVSLVDNSSNTIDTYSYSGTVQGKSFARTPDGGGWHENQEPSTSVECITFSLPTPTPTPAAIPTTKTPTPTKKPTPPKSPSPTPTKNAVTITINPTSPNKNEEVLAEKTVSQEATSSNNSIKLNFNEDQKSEPVLVKESSYSKYLSYGLIGIGLIILIVPLVVFLKKKYA